MQSLVDSVLEFVEREAGISGKDLGLKDYIR
jgi:hypothetical protein